MAAAQHFDAVYVDMNLAGHEGGGLALAQRLRKELPALRYTPFAIITAAPGERARRAVANTHILRYIMKTDPTRDAGGCCRVISGPSRPRDARADLAG